MRIIKGTEHIEVTHPVFLIFGQPGICKSSLGYSMKDPLTLDFDHGAHRAANRRDTLLIDTWVDVVEAMTAENLAPYSSVVVDTVGRCLDLMTADIALNDPKKAPGGNLTQQGWGVLKNRFRNWMSALRGLGKDVLLIAHDKEDKDPDGSRIVRPDIVGGSFGEVMKIADFVGYACMSGKDRILDFNPTDKWLGKNPAGWTPLKVPPVAKAQSVMAELFDKGRAALGAISAESSKVTEYVNDWRAAIQTYTTIEELIGAVAQSNGLPPIVMAQVKRLIADRAKELEFVYDAKAKTFINNQKVTA